jgi:hypothetical protein
VLLPEVPVAPAAVEAPVEAPVVDAVDALGEEPPAGALLD